MGYGVWGMGKAVIAGVTGSYRFKRNAVPQAAIPPNFSLAAQGFFMI
jgi:hypothetical protein